MSDGMGGERFQSVMTGRVYVVLGVDPLEPWKRALEDVDGNVIRVGIGRLLNSRQFVALSTSGEVKP